MKSQPRKKTTNEFIISAKYVHGDEYDYSLVRYERNSTPVEIICKKHGVFLQSYVHHVTRKQRCPKCYGSPRKTTEEFVTQAKTIHLNKQYNYSLVDYKNNKKPVKIICEIEGHGIFEQGPIRHLNGEGCPKCAGKNRTTEDVVKQFIKKHGDKYDYSKVNFINNDIDVIIICPIHDEFKLDPGHHLLGVGCRKCSGKGLTNLEWIDKAKQVHNKSNYDYSKFLYKGTIIKTIVICQKQNHGEFNVTPNDHINSGTGCPICKESKGEKFITQLLDNNNIVYTKQKRYNDCKGGNGKYSKKLPFDFYLLDNNILIEYDGRQHFQPVYGEEQLNKQKQLDNIKNQYCENNNIKLIRIPYTMKNVDVELFLKQELNIV